MTKSAIAAITLAIAVLAVMLAVAPATATESAEEERLREDIARATIARNRYQSESERLVRLRDNWIQEIRDFYAPQIERADNQVRIWNNAIAGYTEKLEALAPTPPPAAPTPPPAVGCVIEPCGTTTTTAAATPPPAAPTPPPAVGCVIEPCGTTTTTAAPTLTEPTIAMEEASQREVNRIMRRKPPYHHLRPSGPGPYYTREEDRLIYNSRIEELCKDTNPDLSDTTKQYFTLEVRVPIITQANRDTGHIYQFPYNQNANTAWCDVVPRVGQNRSLAYPEMPRSNIIIYTDSWHRKDAISLSAENWPLSVAANNCVQISPRIILPCGEN